MMTIALHNVQLRGYHGIHPEELLTGNQFLINCSVDYTTPERVKHIDDTLNYVQLFELIKTRMQKPTPLLETLAQDICGTIFEQFAQATEVRIDIQKLNPLITGFQGTVGIAYTAKRP